MGAMQESLLFSAPSFGDAYELRVTLRDTAPPIWRALRVPAELPLGALHDVLQIAFGWNTAASGLHPPSPPTIPAASANPILQPHIRRIRSPLPTMPICCLVHN